MIIWLSQIAAGQGIMSAAINQFLLFPFMACSTLWRLYSQVFNGFYKNDAVRFYERTGRPLAGIYV